MAELFGERSASREHAFTRLNSLAINTVWRELCALDLEHLFDVHVDRLQRIYLRRRDRIEAPIVQLLRIPIAPEVREHLIDWPPMSAPGSRRLLG